MKQSISTILITSNFTSKSENALRLAMQMAVRHNARVIILHNVENYFVTDRTGRQLLGSDTVADNVRNAEHKLNEIEQSMKQQFPRLCIQTFLKSDSFLQAVNELVHDEDVDLVVCGTSGKQHLSQTILGSVSYELMNGANCSVLMVPEQCRKYSFDKILVPVRVLENLLDKVDLSVTIAKKNQGIINLLGISSRQDVENISKTYQHLRKSLDYRSQEYRSSFYITHDKGSKIASCSKEEDSDIIILNYEDEDSWKSLFSENFFKKIINGTDIPLLFLKNKYLQNNSNKVLLKGIDITLPHPG